jgi:protein-S-isoprenylcysteine O-methyltransferase Ste14
MAILGVTLIFAVYLFRSGHVVVSHEQRPAEVVSSGAFRYVRHPLYLGCVLVYIGMTFATASLICLGLAVIIFLFYNYIAGYEERLLETKFGPAYVTYKKKTGKWMPTIGRRK